MELDSEGKAFVGALDGLDNINAVGHGHTCHPQRSASHVTHDLMVPRGHAADGVGASNAKEQRAVAGNRDVMGSVVAFALRIALHAVQIMVIFAHFIEELAQILNEWSPRNDRQHLHAATEAQHRDIVVKAIGHREIFRHIACGIGRTIIGDAVPGLGLGKQCRTDIATT